MTYTIEAARHGMVCYECGKPAVLVLVADNQEPETGYTDEVPLCETCAQRRGV